MTNSSNGNNSHNSNTGNNGNGKKVTEDQAKRLKEMLDRLNQRSATGGNGSFLKIKDGECKRLQFDFDKYSEEEVKYPSNPSKAVHRVKFMVKEVLNGKTADVEKEWTASSTAGKIVLKWLAKGYDCFDVSRTGSGLNDTRYEVDPVL